MSRSRPPFAKRRLRARASGIAIAFHQHLIEHPFDRYRAHAREDPVLTLEARELATICGGWSLVIYGPIEPLVPPIFLMPAHAI